MGHMDATPTILYLNTSQDERVQQISLAGIRRYAGVRGYGVATVPRTESGKVDVRALLSANKPVAGCVVECSDDRENLPPPLFGATPFVYLNAMPSLYRGKGTRVNPDNREIAVAAFRELSAGCPDAFATVAFPRQSEWVPARERAFAALAAKSGKPYFHLAHRRGAKEPRQTLMANWLSSLPRHTAIFAVNDETATEVAAAARAAHRPIPRELTLIGVDNIAALCEASSPTISSIQLDHELAGYLSAKAIGDLLATKNTKDNKGFVDSAPSAEILVKPLLAVRRESTGGHGRREPFILEAMEIIRREACDGINAEKLAKRFRCSRRLFDLRFREATGHSVLDEILHTRLEQVLALLSRPDFPIDAIADCCGFGGRHALRKLFRKRYGCTMTKWRCDNAVKR